MKLFGNGDWIKVTRAQAGWRCVVLFGAYDSTQFTKTQNEFGASSTWFMFALLKGLFGARRMKHQIEAAAKGTRVALGWEQLAAVFVCLLMYVASASAADQGFSERVYVEWSAAKAQSVESGKPIFVTFTTNPCKYCGALKKSLDDTKVQKALAGYVRCELTSDDVEAVKLAQVSTYPTCLIVKPDGRIIANVPGYQPPELLLDLLAYGVAPEKMPDALDEVNILRARRGLHPFQRDDGLVVAASQAASYRARFRITGHVSGGMGDFQFIPPGHSATAGGCAVRGPGEPFAACCVYEHYQYAGAAKVIGPDGRAYCHIFVR